MTKPLILVTCRQMQVELPKHRERIESLGYEVVAPDLAGRQQFTAAELLEYSARLVGIIAGDDELDQFADHRHAEAFRRPTEGESERLALIGHRPSLTPPTVRPTTGPTAQPAETR